MKYQLFSKKNNPQIFLSIYREIYKTPFRLDSTEDRIKLQNIVYLLQETGFPLYKYDFCADPDGGMISDTLQQELARLTSDDTAPLQYNAETMELIFDIEFVLLIPKTTCPDPVLWIRNVVYWWNYIRDNGGKDPVVERDKMLMADVCSMDMAVWLSRVQKQRLLGLR